MENKQVQHVKKNFDENNLDVAEKKLDQKMDKLANKGWVKGFLNSKRLSSIVNSKLVHDINQKLHPHLKTIFLVIGWISVVVGVLQILMFIFSPRVSLIGLGFFFSFGFGIGVRVLIYILIGLIFSLLTLLSGIGMIQLKKWVIYVMILSFIVIFLSFIIAILPSGFYVSLAYGGVWSHFLNLLLIFVLLVLVVKNKEMFKN